MEEMVVKMSGFMSERNTLAEQACKFKELTKERDEAVADKWKLKDALIKSSEKREVCRYF